MRRITFAFALILSFAYTAFAGGLVTNTNQSAQFVRMLSRNASTQIDAVYFNPAGVAFMQDGWHFALNNQSVFQERTVTSNFPLLNNGKYIGDVKAPLFPSAFAVYKMDRLAFSLGFGPVGGGGSATFDRGLPSFEIPLTKLVPALSGLKALPAPLTADVQGYDANLYFDGTSVYWGIQFGATYKMSDQFAGFLGVRYMPSSNVYSGYIKDIQLKVNNEMKPAGAFLTQTATGMNGLVTQLQNGANQFNTVANNLTPLVAAAGQATLAQLQAAGHLSAEQVTQIKGGLIQMGRPQAEIDALNITQVQGLYSAGAVAYYNQSQVLGENATALTVTAAGLNDKQVETKQTGAGITPIIGFNYAPSESFNLAVKYEHKTKLELTNSTEIDDLGLFPDGQSMRSDVPGILAVGVGYKPSNKLETQLSYNLYFDKGVDWGPNVRDIAVWKGVKSENIRQREIDKNGWEVALGLQYNLSDAFALSVGGLSTNPGFAESYQSDFAFSNKSITVGAGFQWNLNQQLTLDAGFLNTFYKDDEPSFTDPNLPNSYTEVLGKSNYVIAFGLSYSIGK